ncbi:transposase [Hymenobacter yonginensis]|uniref:Transposase n=1 Tax=Hymenobacter yonginensis TaxID=748197 RepID=A0ABY7PVF5_9BACT|nr:transposase [Hymenobacter yonginensis]WBO86645.1 transposase [Hymenobacter yonginensis]
MDRSSGGFCMKVHAVVDALANCLHLVLTPGKAADSPQLSGLLAAQPSTVVADKAYDTNNILEAITLRQAAAVIPPEVNRLNQRDYFLAA